MEQRSANSQQASVGAKTSVSKEFRHYTIRGLMKTMYQDKTLVCKDCGQEFVFTAGEQEFYEEKGFQNEPLRCKTCRQNNKRARNARREMHDVICAECGKETQVPFLPKDDRPVYCSECFAAIQEAQK